MWWPDKAPPGKRQGKVSATLSNRRAGPLQSPACMCSSEFGNFNCRCGFWFRVLVGFAIVFELLQEVNRVSEKPVYLSKEAGLREDRRTQRRGTGCALEAPALRDPEARCEPAALRSAARRRRRLQVL